MVNWVDPVTPEDVAAIVTIPAAMPEARPGSAPPMVWIEASAGIEEDQAAELVRLAVEPSLYVPVAANCFVAPTLIELPCGATATDTSVLELEVMLS